MKQNGNGHAPSFEQQIRDLLSEYETKVDRLRRALTALGAEVNTSVVIDLKPLPPRRPRRPHRRRQTPTKTAAIARRERTGAFLAQFTKKRPLYIANAGQYGLAPLVYHGYLKKEGRGWVRTNKPYHV